MMPVVTFVALLFASDNADTSPYSWIVVIWTSQDQARYKNLHIRSEFSSKILESSLVQVGSCVCCDRDMRVTRHHRDHHNTIMIHANPAVRLSSTASVRAIFVAACNWRVGIR